MDSSTQQGVTPTDSTTASAPSANGQDSQSSAVAKPNRYRGLRPYKPGQSGNPGGKRKRPQTDANDAFLRSVIPPQIRAKLDAATLNVHGVALKLKFKFLKPGATWADAIALALGKKAVLQGDVLAAKELRESVEGKSPHRVEIINPQDREKLQVNVVMQQAMVTNPAALERAIDFQKRLEMESAPAVNEEVVAAVVSSPEVSGEQE